MQIRQAETAKELKAVYHFRYKIYSEEMQRKQQYVDHKDRVIIDPLDLPTASVFAAWNGDEVIGTVRTNFLRSSNIGEYMDYYALSDLPAELLNFTSITTRLMVHSEYRSSALVHRLVCRIYEYGLEQGISTDFCDCNSHLVPYFTKLGYLSHRTSLIHPEYGAVTVLRLDLRDSAHLKKIGSPFTKTLSRKDCFLISK